MPIDLGLAQIPRNSRTGHNAHFPPRIIVEVACRAETLWRLAVACYE
jgi:hypothetical protein